AAPVPRVSVDVHQLYAEADRRRQKQLRRWRQMACAGAAMAAALLLVVGLKLQIRAEPGAIIVRWGSVREQKTPLPTPPPAAPTPPPVAVTAEDMQLTHDLIHALAGRVDTLDERQRRTATVLALRLEALARRTQDWQAAQQQRTAFHPTENQALEDGGKP
ncbi:MAG TPA: hypothetical protein VFA18_22950, partial [Gemmataceae bacterium]|nr:hypothetical protein [Gemmataceae bacterium]